MDEKQEEVLNIGDVQVKISYADEDNPDVLKALKELLEKQCFPSKTAQ